MKKKFLKKIRRKLENKRKGMSINNSIDYEIDIIENSSSPIADRGILGEAHPHKNPPKINLEIYPCEVNEGEINHVITDELLHIKRPDLKQYDEEKLNEREEWKEVYEKYINK